MTKKEKITRIDKAIKDTKTELAIIQQEKQTATDSPEKLVMAEKKERRIAERINALERAKAAVDYKPPELSDKEELLQSFKRYAEEHAAKVSKVQDSIKAAEAERAEIDQGLQSAAEDCDTAKTVELSEKKTEGKASLHICKKCWNV